MGNWVKSIFVIIFGSIAVSALSDTYIAVAKNGNVYDEANAKYITLNQNNDEVSVIPGMVFKTSEHQPGWFLVEYSPGLRAYLPEQLVTTNFNPVKEGSYKIVNNPSNTLVITGNGDDWSATVGNKTYKGTKYEDIIIFVDADNNVIYSLVDVGSGPIAITYDNAVTKFF